MDSSRLSPGHAATPRIVVAPPALNLRKAASYNSQDRGPLSSTSSRFNFNHLLFSPPPSPSLPALVPRAKKPQSPTRILTKRPKRAFRLLFYFLSSLMTVYVVVLGFRAKHAMRAIPPVWPQQTDIHFEMVGQDMLPDFPIPIVVTDSNGKSKWTVSVPQEYDFPLSMKEYSDIMDQCREVSAQVRAAEKKKPLTEDAILASASPDKYFVDVPEAEKTNLLPATVKGLEANDAGNFVGVNEASLFGKPVCESSMTFVLESSDAGLGNALMLMWTLYALAKERGKAFFVDDSRWAYGNYTEMFQAPPIPDCQPPPRHHMIPCPPQAKHLVVTAATSKEVLPSLLAEHHRLATVTDETRDAFELARTGYRSFFTLTQKDQDYVDARVKKIRTQAKPGQAEARAAPIIGLHVRRGDRHPLEYQYRDTYIPSEVFLAHAGEIVDQHYNGSGSDATTGRAITVLASDDPTLLRQSDFQGSLPAQERIKLASKDTIKEANQNRQFVDDSFGWEGGFFAPMFWNLGVDRQNNAANAPSGVKLDNVNDAARHTAPPSVQTLKLRSLMGRAYAMDLAVLADASDTVVCAVSAIGCRLLAVMKGWDEGIAGGGWVNVDGDYSWMGIN